MEFINLGEIYMSDLSESLSYRGIYLSKSDSMQPQRNMLCPKTHVRNPRTKRCVKKCKPGFTRNKKFQCRKRIRSGTPLMKDIYQRSSSSLSSRKCPPNKDYNRRTRRCNNKCKPGFIRNKDFRCRKAK